MIEQLRLEKFAATPGTYAQFKMPNIKDFDSSIQFNMVLETIPRCNVCGIGGMFLSAVRLNNELTAEEAGVHDANGMTRSMYDSGMRKYLSKWFSASQLSLIESAFERRELGAAPKEYNAMKDNAIAMGVSIRNAGDRLIAICENIMENRGIFKPVKPV